MFESAQPLTWPGYSIAERDRRWSAIREKARTANLDGILVPFGNRFDARYVSQILDSAVVLPTDAGRAPIVITDAKNDWAPEPRSARGDWGKAMADALVEAGMERGRIGVAGLGPGLITYVRNQDGVLDREAFAEVQRRLP